MNELIFAALLACSNGYDGQCVLFESPDSVVVQFCAEPTGKTRGTRERSFADPTGRYLIDGRTWTIIQLDCGSAPA